MILSLLLQADGPRFVDFLIMFALNMINLIIPQAIFLYVAIRFAIIHAYKIVQKREHEQHKFTGTYGK